MEYTRLGRSGLKVSRVGLGCMSYGQAASGMHQWTLDEDAAAPFFQQAVELGVTFWDTANVYRAARRRSSWAAPSTSTPAAKTLFLPPRSTGKMHDGPGGSGLSRKAILEQPPSSSRGCGPRFQDHDRRLGRPQRRMGV
jgi:aryl-alcohol dehydrogenase-like predicted oxidoreductase